MSLALPSLGLGTRFACFFGVKSIELPEISMKTKFISDESHAFAPFGAKIIKFDWQVIKVGGK